jgi:hypothetical protein
MDAPFPSRLTLPCGENAEHLDDKPKRSAIETPHEQFSVDPSDRLEQLKKLSDLEPLVTQLSLLHALLDGNVRQWPFSADLFDRIALCDRPVVDAWWDNDERPRR